MSKLNKICVIITAFNEENTIEEVVTKTKNVLGDVEIIVIDDGSTDSTAQVARDSDVTAVISHERNQGVGVALKTGIIASLSLNPDIIVKIDGDGQHLPEDIPKLIQPILEDKADLVLGNRFSQAMAMPFYKKMGNRFFTWLTNKMTGYNLTDTQTGFRAIKGSKASVLIPMTGMFTYAQEMIIHASKNGIRVVEVPITSLKRRYGGSRIVRNPVDYGLRVLLILIRTFTNYNPLLIFGVPGIFAITGSLVIYFYLFWEWITLGKAIIFSPTTLMIATVLFISGVQILMFALLADMIKGLIKNEFSLAYRNQNNSSND